MNIGLSKHLLVRVLTIICPAFLLGAPPLVAAGGFDLRVNDVSGLDGPWPMIAGLPFPERELHDGAQIRVVDGDGREVPAQIDVVATWRDGSIRWAQVGLNASPQDTYRVEYGPEIARSAFDPPLQVQEKSDGVLIVDTGVATYIFRPDQLLPDVLRLDDTVVFEDAGDGAYLIDNRGRIARVAGQAAEVETELLKKGPGRVVVRREGWYVTGDGQQVARAKAWFYLTAGSPYLRITHTLVFTEDTNERWVRDYGLEFPTPDEPSEVVFAHREAEDIERVSAADQGSLSRDQREAWTHPISAVSDREMDLFKLVPDGDEVYLLQDVYPHLLEREFLAVVGRGVSSEKSFWLEPWDLVTEVAGDWGDAQYESHGLTVVMPQLAQRFPKEIAFGPDGVRVVFWSGRSGRELDFRAVTLMNEYWQEWAAGEFRGEPRAPDGPWALAAHPSNAQGAARTHDVWLLPHRATDDPQAVATRARAASNPPLLHADPKWLCGTEAIGWPVHPRDEDRFPEVEAMLDQYWRAVMNSYQGLRHTGFIEWGKNHTLRHARSWFFRLSRLTDYGLGRYVWAQYGRSGDRGYWEYGSPFNRFVGDWELANWTAGDKVKAAFVTGDNNLPMHWGEGTYPGLIRCEFDITGQTILPWLLEYYMTGNEQVMDLTRMVEGAYRAHWNIRRHPYSTSDLHMLALLYSLDWDETFAEMARQRARQCIDLDNPTGIDDHKRHGSLYKLGTDLLPLYEYYQITGDPVAREAFLQGVDYMYRLGDRPHTNDHLTEAMKGQNYIGILFAIAYRWTGNENYLRVVQDQIRQGVEQMEEIRGSIHGNPYFLLNTPAGLGLIAEAEGEIGTFPVLSYPNGDAALPVQFEKVADRSVTMNLYVRLNKTEQEDAALEVVVEKGGSEIAFDVEVDTPLRSENPSRRDMHGRHVRLIVPADAPEGLYTLRLPNAERVLILDSDADGIQLSES